MDSGVHLITYADRLGGGNLTTIHELLGGRLDGLFTGVHLLPFYSPFDGEDAGFDPVDHATVDSRLGSWSDIARIATSHVVTADLIVNHVSDKSKQFVDFLALGDESEFAGMFLEFSTVFPDGATKDELGVIYRPRPGLPLTDVTLSDGSTRKMWTTFTPHQIDIDTNHESSRRYLLDVLDTLADAGVGIVRLDAIGYAVKTAGTSCFMTPETHNFITWMVNEVHSRGMRALLEVHAHHLDQIDIARDVDLVYDFALPPLILHSLYTGNGVALRSWLEMSPRNCVTVLDTHDGIGVIDIGSDDSRPGLLEPEDINRLVERIHDATKGESRQATGEAASNLDLYQVNSTFYSALSCNDNDYLLARLVQLFSPGIPQIYYAGLLTAPNDMDLLAKTGSGRDINRPYLSPPDIDDAMNRPVVEHLAALIRFRNTNEAFHGEFTVQPGEDHKINLHWTTPDHNLSLTVDLTTRSFKVQEPGRPSKTTWSDF